MIDWPSRVLLALTSGVLAFAVSGLVMDGLPQSTVALAGPTPSPVIVTPPTVDPLGLLEAIPAGEVTPTPADVEAPPVTIAFAGDVHGEPPIDNVLSEGENPLEAMAGMLADADVAVVNLETAIGTVGTPADKTFTFQADPALATALADAGVDIANLANNHALDYGYEAAAETVRLARGAGLATIGYGEDEDSAYAAHVVDVDGRTVAFVGLTRVLPTITWEAVGDRAGMASAYDAARAVQAVRDAAGQADHVVVFIHWGQERHTCPNGNQVELARAFAAAGADVVVGHHPHVLQGLHDIDGTLVAYSIGNFVFYATRASQRQTGVLQVVLGPGGVQDHVWAPGAIDGRGRPQPVASQADIPPETGTVTTGGVSCGPPR